MTDLSPAARAVFESFNSKFDWVEDGVPGPEFKAIAAAFVLLHFTFTPKTGATAATNVSAGAGSSTASVGGASASTAPDSTSAASARSSSVSPFQMLLA